MVSSFFLENLRGICMYKHGILSKLRKQTLRPLGHWNKDDVFFELTHKLNLIQEVLVIQYKYCKMKQEISVDLRPSRRNRFIIHITCGLFRSITKVARPTGLYWRNYIPKVNATTLKFRNYIKMIKIIYVLIDDHNHFE